MRFFENISLAVMSASLKVAYRIRLKNRLSVGYSPFSKQIPLKITYRPTAVLVLPPCWVMRGRHLIFTAPRVNESSEALLDHT